MKEYLWNEFRYNVQKKYYKYFDEWYENITETQKMYFTAYMEGKKSPFQGKSATEKEVKNKTCTFAV